MPYAIADFELTEPLRPLILADDEDGAFLLARVHARPVHHAIVPLPRGATVPADEVLGLLGPEAPAAVLEDALRRELLPPSDPPPVDLTAAICTRARTELLEACLRSLAAAGLPGARREILVVDNAPPDDATRGLVAALPGMRYALEPRTGPRLRAQRALPRRRTACSPSSTTTWWSTRTGSTASTRRGRVPRRRRLRGLVLPYRLDTRAQIAFEHFGGFGRGFAAPLHRHRVQGNPLFPLGAGVFGAGGNMALPPDAAAAPGRLRRGAGHRPAAARRRRPRHLLPRAAQGRRSSTSRATLVFHEHRRDAAAAAPPVLDLGPGLHGLPRQVAPQRPAPSGKHTGC